MPVGAVGAIVGTRRARRPPPRSDVCEQRERDFEELMKKQAELAELFKKYDTNNSGKLEEDQVKALLTDMDSSTPPGTQPSDDELKFIIKCVDKEEDGCLTRNEVKFALRAWQILIKKRKEIETALEKFDKSGTGKLDKSELKEYLTSLNAGIEVADDEVEWVLSQADIFGDGAMSKPELTMATAAWYSHVKQKEKEQAQSACCTVM